MGNKFKDIFVISPVYHLFAFILLLIMLLGVFEGAADHYIQDLNHKSLGILVLVAEIKQLLSSIGDIKIPLIEGAIQEATVSFNKVEDLLMISAVLAHLQLLIIAFSKIFAFKIAAIVLFIATFFQKTSQVSKKILVLILILSPGLVLYSAAVKQLSDSMNGVDDELHGKLEKISSNLRKEKSQLMMRHQAKLKKIEHGHEHFKFFRKLAEDISYDLRDAADSIEGDIKEFRAIIRYGAKHLLEDVVKFITRTLFFMAILPIVYFLIVYLMARVLFSEGFSRTELSILKGSLARLYDSNKKNTAGQSNNSNNKIESEDVDEENATSTNAKSDSDPNDAPVKKSPAIKI